VVSQTEESSVDTVINTDGKIKAGDIDIGMMSIDYRGSRTDDSAAKAAKKEPYITEGGYGAVDMNDVVLLEHLLEPRPA
jgi:hypothetical protein